VVFALSSKIKHTVSEQPLQGAAASTTGTGGQPPPAQGGANANK
jgi:hypothetical protein